MSKGRGPIEIVPLLPNERKPNDFCALAGRKKAGQPAVILAFWHTILKEPPKPWAILTLSLPAQRTGIFGIMAWYSALAKPLALLGR